MSSCTAAIGEFAASAAEAGVNPGRRRCVAPPGERERPLEAAALRRARRVRFSSSCQGGGVGGVNGEVSRAAGAGFGAFFFISR